MSSTLRFHKVARKHEQNYSLKCIKSTRLHIIITPLHNASVQTLTSKEHKQECLFHHCVYHHIGENGCVATSTRAIFSKKKTHTHSTFSNVCGWVVYCPCIFTKQAWLLLLPCIMVTTTLSSQHCLVCCLPYTYVYIYCPYILSMLYTNKQTNKQNKQQVHMTCSQGPSITVMITSCLLTKSIRATIWEYRCNVSDPSTHIHPIHPFTHKKT